MRPRPAASFPVVVLLLFPFLLIPLGCGDSSSTGVTVETEPDDTPATLAATTQSSLEAAVAEEVSVGVRVTTASGKGVGGVTVSFSVTGGGGSVAAGAVQTTATGTATTTWTLGTAVGTNTLQVSAASLSPVAFTADAHAGPPATVTPFLGMDQSGPAGAALPLAIAAWVKDAYGNDAPGVPVSFSAGSGGRVSGAFEETDQDGTAVAWVWRLGPSAGQQTVELQVGTLAPVVFSATAYAVDSPFDIHIRYEDEGDFNATEKAAIASAVTRLRSFMGSPPPSMPVKTDGFQCDVVSIPPVDESIDNPVVFVYKRDFEADPAFENYREAAGLGNMCGYRIADGDPDYRTTVIGMVVINSRNMHLERGFFERLAAHELLHALGFSSWGKIHPNLRDLVDGRQTDDPRFTGSGAIQAYGDLPNNGQGPVPVPVQLGKCGHWRLPLFGGELMAPTLTDAVAAISAVTVASLADLGWEVDLSRAEEYSHYNYFTAPPYFRAPAPRTPGTPILFPTLVPEGHDTRSSFAPPRAWDLKTGKLIWKGPNGGRGS